MKSTLYGSIFLVFSLFFFLVFSVGFWEQKKPSESFEEAEEAFVLKPKESLESLSRRLYREGFIGSQFLFKILVRVKYQYENFKAGRYLLSKKMSSKEIIGAMLLGDIYNELVFKLVVPEGFSLREILGRLVSKGYDLSELESLAYGKNFIKELGLEGDSLEGFLYPSTYRFYNKHPPAKEIFKMMVHKFFKELPKAYLKRIENMDLSLRSSVIIASLIEKETSLISEKNFIAEVIFNRLKKNMTLGIDASLVYGIKNFSGNLTYDDLRNRSNRYNTRVHKGLPPGPICSPSKSSLEAVLTPSKEGFLFYVLKPGENQKEHHFSKALPEHNRHVRKLLE